MDNLLNKVNMFAVIRVDQDYDYVAGAECVGTFETYESADELIVKMKNDTKVSWENKIAYVNDFVDKIEVPVVDFKNWDVFLQKFPFSYRSYITPGNFKKSLKEYLTTNGNRLPKMEEMGYRPPEIVGGTDNLFVVEIKNYSDRDGQSGPF